MSADAAHANALGNARVIGLAWHDLEETFLSSLRPENAPGGVGERCLYVLHRRSAREEDGMTPEELARILEAGCDHAEPGTTLVCRECVGAMIAEEREACARIVETLFERNVLMRSHDAEIAAAIRART